MMYNLSFDDLTFIVCAANIAGYMEAEEKIFVPDDEELAGTCLVICREYERLEEEIAFDEYAAMRLKDFYG